MPDTCHPQWMPFCLRKGRDHQPTFILVKMVAQEAAAVAMVAMENTVDMSLVTIVVIPTLCEMGNIQENKK